MEKRISKKELLIRETKNIISEYTTRLTLRQIFYRLVSKGILKNTLTEYKYLGKSLVYAREQNMISYDSLEDRTRAAITVDDYYISHEVFFNYHKQEYDNSEDTFKDSWKNYQLPLWHKQPKYVEVWLEKEALAGLFQQVTSPESIVLSTARGYPSLTLLHDGYKRFMEPELTEKEFYILYFGDYDPSGKDIERNIRERLNIFFNIDVKVKRIAITKQQIEKYNIPPMPAKRSDSRYNEFVKINGDIAVELDAIEPNTLQDILRESINGLFDMDIRKENLKEEEIIKEELKEEIKKELDK